MKPYNIHNSCIRYCVIALTKVIVFVIVLKNWHFNDPNLDSEPPALCQIHLKILKSGILDAGLYQAKSQNSEYLCTFTV